MAMKNHCAKLYLLAAVILTVAGVYQFPATSAWRHAKHLSKQLSKRLLPSFPSGRCDLSNSLTAAGEITDINLRGPTGGAAPLNFEYDRDKVFAYIQRHRAGGHLSTSEQIYVLQAYEQEYRYRITHAGSDTDLREFCRPANAANGDEPIDNVEYFVSQFAIARQPYYPDN